MIKIAMGKLGTNQLNYMFNNIFLSSFKYITYLPCCQTNAAFLSAKQLQHSHGLSCITKVPNIVLAILRHSPKNALPLLVCIHWPIFIIVPTALETWEMIIENFLFHKDDSLVSCFFLLLCLVCESAQSGQAT